MSVYKQDLKDLTETESQLVVRLSDFDYGDVIGKGGFGEVNRAIQKATGRDCAIKQIFTERLEGNRLRRYIGEIKTMARCDNMFLVPFVGFTAEPPYAIVSEYMPNGALDNYIRHRNSETLSGTQLTAIAIGIAYGMIHLHNLKIIHRDLKAANILLDSRLFPRICDFGIARFENSGASGMTAKIGTPNYMAPELITSKDYDRKVDVYAYAMILYEMSENTRPFKGLKVNEIFQHVVQRDERPHFTRATPPQLQKLIKRCWDRDPEVRPTFDEIFEEFRKGRVFFADTRSSDIEKFLKVIQKDEEKRRMSGDKAIPHAFQSSNSSDSSDYSYESESVPARCRRSASERVPIRNSNIVPAQPQRQTSKRYMQESDILESNDYSSSSSSDSSESSDQADRVLRNARDPAFLKYLDYYSRTIEPNQFNPFYQPISTHIKPNTPTNVLVPVLTACYNLMRRNSKFIHLFLSTRFFVNLPVKNEGAVDKIVDCYSLLFVEYPKALGQAHCSQLAVLLEKRPEKMLVLHSYYARQLLNLSNPWPVLDSLISSQRVIMQKNLGYLFLSLFYYLLKRYSIYAKERSVHLRGVFLAFLKAKDKTTIITAYHGLADLYDDFKGLDFTLITRHLRDPEIADAALSLLIRVKKNVNPSKEFVDALLERSKESPKPWIVMLNIANTKRGAEFLLKYHVWMAEYTKHPREVARVFLVLFKESDKREAATNLPGFTGLLKALLNTDDKHMHSAVTSTVRRAPQTPELLKKLADDGVIKLYIEKTIKGGTQKQYANALAFFDALSRIGYSPTFLLFIQHLIDLLSKQQLAPDAITVIVSLSFYRECAAVFKKDDDLIEYFRTIGKHENFSHASHVFMKNIEKV